MKVFFRVFCFLMVVLALPSCRVLYPNMMFLQKDYQFFELEKKQIKEYVIAPGDQFSFTVYSRDGFKLIDVLYEGIAAGSSVKGGYLVDDEGFAKLPILGEFYVKGYTESELERILAEKLSNLVFNPFVVVSVNNRRVFLFHGSSGTVVQLGPTPMTIFEVIARAGGVAAEYKSYKIKIIRGDLKNPQIYMVDLSTLEGVRKSNLIIQSNDIIYLEPKRYVIQTIINQTGPLFSISSAIFSIWGLVLTWKNSLK